MDMIQNYNKKLYMERKMNSQKNTENGTDLNICSYDKFFNETIKKKILDVVSFKN